MEPKERKKEVWWHLFYRGSVCYYSYYYSYYYYDYAILVGGSYNDVLVLSVQVVFGVIQSSG